MPPEHPVHATARPTINLPHERQLFGHVSGGLCIAFQFAYVGLCEALEALVGAHADKLVVPNDQCDFIDAAPDGVLYLTTGQCKAMEAQEERNQVVRKLSTPGGATAHDVEAHRCRLNYHEFDIKRVAMLDAALTAAANVVVVEVGLLLEIAT